MDKSCDFLFPLRAKVLFYNFEDGMGLLRVPFAPMSHHLFPLVDSSKAIRPFSPPLLSYFKRNLLNGQKALITLLRMVFFF